ncbi:MAG: hypothetical protein ACXWZW_07280 [Solirubrobacterales bacterium]
MPSPSHRKARRLRRSLAPAVLLALAAALLGAPGAASAAAPNCVDSAPGEQKCTYRVPITVKPYEVLQTTSQLSGSNRAPQFDGMVTKMETDIVDAAGAPVPISRLMLHHIVFLNVAKADSTCSSLIGWDSRPSGLMRERFFAAGEERAKMSLPDGYGYDINSANNWLMLYMVMNHRQVTDSAFVEYTATVKTDTTGMTPVEPYWMDINDCHVDPYYNVPGTGGPGSLDVVTRDVTIQEPGRIVAGIGHVHGGAKQLTLSQPGCGNRQIAQSIPTWGDAVHPFYNVRPILHEPGPVNMTAFQTEQGIPVRAGEVVRLNSIYDNSRPHTRVMGIETIYVAPDAGVTQPCGALPTDQVDLGIETPGRKATPQFTVPLTGLDAAGNAYTITEKPRKPKWLPGGSTITVGDRYFSKPTVEVYRRKGLNFQFTGNELHNITLANGPIGIASDNLDGNRTFHAKFDRPGTYNFFCSLHPVSMHERVVVKKKKKKKGKKGKKGKAKSKRR